MEDIVGELRANVASRFERLGLPTWPDPHPDRVSPADEEYSRVTDPARFRMVHIRGRVWAEVLGEVLGADTETLAPTSARAETAAFDRGVRITPRRPGALPLLLLERDVATRPDDGPLAVLEIAVARSDVVVAMQPDCGCDACDSGSSQLLEAIDSMIGRVVGGPFVVLRCKKWNAQWHPEGSSASSAGRGPDFESVMDLCRRLADGEAVRLPRGTESFVGRSWLG